MLFRSQRDVHFGYVDRLFSLRHHLREQQAWQNISQGWKQLTINQGNLDVNDKNALTNELRLRFDKEIKDVSQSTQMTVETVTDILMSLLGSRNQRVRVKGLGN